MEASSTTELRFRRGQASAAQIQAVVDEVLAELSDPTSEAAEQAREVGLDPDTLAEAKVSVNDGQQGAEPILTTILIGIVIKLGADVGKQLWDDVIWYRVRRRLGAKAVGEEAKKPSNGPTSEETEKPPNEP
jgi:hypothetical protein